MFSLSSNRWNGLDNDKLEYVFPELVTHPEIATDRPPIGLGFSGGGSRAYTVGLGAARALSTSGLLGRSGRFALRFVVIVDGAMFRSGGRSGSSDVARRRRGTSRSSGGMCMCVFDTTRWCALPLSLRPSLRRSPNVTAAPPLRRSVRYLSTVSGGSWFNSVFMYDQHGVDDATLLCPYLSPEVRSCRAR